MHHRPDAGVGDLRWRSLLVVLGTALLVGSVVVGFTGWTDTHRHDVRAAGSGLGAPTEGAPVLGTDDLAVDERAVLLEAIASESPVWTDGPVGARFQYPPGPEGAEYVVELDDTRYLLETATETRPLTILAGGLRVSFAAAGALLLVSGGVSLLQSVLFPNVVLSRQLNSLLDSWFPASAGLALVPSVVLVVVYPLVFETFVDVPLSLFITPFLLGTALCATGTALVLRTVEVPAPLVLGTALNVPLLWAVTVALVVAPTAGEARMRLTLVLWVVGLSVLVGQVLGWYVQRWNELRKREHPHHTVYERT